MEEEPLPCPFCGSKPATDPSDTCNCTTKGCPLFCYWFKTSKWNYRRYGVNTEEDEENGKL